MKRWLPIQFKRMWRLPGTWIFAAAALVMLAVMSHFFWRGNEIAPIGIMTGGGRCSEAIVSDCLQGKKKELYRRYSSGEEMRKDVLKGRLDCAFILGEDLDHTVLEETGEPAITYYHTPSTQRGLIAKEEVYAAVLRVKSEQMLIEMSDDPKVFKKHDDALAEKLLERQAYYKDSDEIFRVIWDDVSADSADVPEKKDKAAGGRLMMAVLLVMAAAFAMGRERYSDVYRGISPVMRTPEKAGYLISYALAGAAPVTLLMILALPASLALSGQTAAVSFVALCVLGLIAVWLVSALAATGLAALVRNETAYLYAMTVLLILVWLIMMLGRMLAD